MLRVREILYAASFALALYGGTAAAQPTPATSSSGAPYDDLARRVEELRADVTGMQCISDDLRREIGALQAEVLKMNAKFDRATASNVPIDPDFVKAHDRMTAGVKAIRDAVAKADKVCPRGPRPGERPVRPPQPPRRPPEQPSDTIVPQPKLAPADVVPPRTTSMPEQPSDTIVPQPKLAPADVVRPPTTSAPEPDNGFTDQRLAQRLRDLQEKVRNSYCVTPELQNQFDDLRRDLDKATKGLDLKKPFDQVRLQEHGRMTRELFDVDKAMHKLPQACPKTEKISPVDEPPPPPTDDRFPPPTRPLGGTDLGVNCNEKDRTDERLKLQEELLPLEQELIKTDGTTPKGRARQIELQREIKRITDLIELLKQPCPPKGGAKPTKPHDISDDLDKRHELIDITPTSHQNERPPQSTPPPQQQTDHRFPPPTTPLGGKQPAGCTDKERTDERLKLQEEVLKLEGELIRTDGTTPTGRARQTELQREIKRATDEMETLRKSCPYEIGARRTNLPELAQEPASVEAEQPPNGSAMPPVNRLIQPVYDMINAERAQLGLPPLERDPVLEQHSQQHANEMRDANDVEHASRNGRVDERENIGKGLPTEAPLQVAQRWAAEKKYFRKGMYPDVCYASGPVAWYLCAHYTMMIWATTTKFGCAWARGTLGFIFVDCRFSPGGNKDDRPVGPAGSDVAAQFKGYLDQHPGTLAADREAYFKVLQPGYGNQLSAGVPAGNQPPAKVKQPVAAQQSLDWAGEMGGRPRASIYAIMDFGEFGDDGLSGFIGGGVGVARVDFNNLRTFSNQAAVIDGSDMDFARHIISGVRCADGTEPPYEQTDVEQPSLPAPDPLEPLVTPDPISRCIM